MKKKILAYLIKCLSCAAGIYLLTLTGSFFTLPDGAYIHIGDFAVYLAGACLPLSLSLPAAVLGSALADLSLGSANYLLATVIVKAAVVFAANKLCKLGKTPLVKDVFVSLCGFITIIGYFVFDIITVIFTDKTLSFATDSLMYNSLQALITAFLYIAFASGVTKLFERLAKK